MVEKIAYYPGCTAKSYAKNFDHTAKQVMKELGYELVELSSWNCCGTVFGSHEDNLAHQLAPLRNLIRTVEDGFNEVVTTCSMCYNTLKRANLQFQNDSEKAERLNAFMYEEEDYEGNVKVLHLIELLRDRVDLQKVLERVEKPLNGLKITPYYGCTLVRPREVSIDENPERPTILSDLIYALGGEVVTDPNMTECCGSYLTVKDKDLVVSRTYKLLKSMSKRGADVVMVSCPLCQFNLDRRQKEAREQHPDLPAIPILYFTQVMALAFGVDPEELGFQDHFVYPSILEKLNLMKKTKKVSVKVKK
ncbi:MAG: heterodisulfide reductase, subunit B [Candidatus Heimdallarchaeota archaeon]|nr:heterodisulfide reductase, subunit B [Candidatus Heimdallarchaeota archaeon]